MTIQDIITELQAVEKTELDQVVAALEKAVTDLQGLPAPSADPVATVSVVTASGATTEFVPKA